MRGLHTGLHADIYALLPIQEEHSSPDGVSCEALHVQQRLVAIQLHGCNDRGCARMLGTQLVLKPQPPVTIIRLAIHPTQLQSRQPWQYIEGGQWDGTLPWRGSRLLLHTSCVWLGKFACATSSAQAKVPATLQKIWRCYAQPGPQRTCHPCC